VERPLLVASDVDGTLLDARDAVSARTRAAIDRVGAAGVPFVLVSGRPPRWIGPVHEVTGIGGIAVCANGAVLYDIDGDQVLDTQAIDPKLLRDVVHTLDEALPHCRIAVERVGETALGLNGAEFQIEVDYQHPWTGDPHQVVPRDQLMGHSVVKLLVSSRGWTSEQIATAAETMLDGAVQITYSTSGGLIEISAAGVTKQSGLALVAETHAVAADDIVAFGDMPNDVPMLDWVGHGVAMANAHPAVLPVADEITAANTEDGVAQVLERWF
jgi:Cof subfamily protein (haloacid dehalogenase superfamily)